MSCGSQISTRISITSEESHHLSKRLNSDNALCGTTRQPVVPPVIIHLRLCIRPTQAIVDQDALDLRRLHAHSTKPLVRQRVAVRLNELPIRVWPQVEELAELGRSAIARHGVNRILLEPALSPRLGDETLEWVYILVLLAQDRVGVVIDGRVGEYHN